MAETYCGKSCAECSKRDILNCPGCKAGPGRLSKQSVNWPAARSERDTKAAKPASIGATAVTCAAVIFRWIIANGH